MLDRPAAAVLARVGLLALGIATGLGCLIPRGFSCAEDAQCNLGGRAGTCVDGSCAYEDETCESMLRWEARAPDGRGDQCTPFEPEPCGGGGQACCEPEVDEPCEPGLTCVDGQCGCAFEIAAGLAHTCAIGAEQVFCWGNNAQAQLGNGLDGAMLRAEARPVMAPLTVDPTIDRLYASDHTCYRKPGTPMTRCWGNNDMGQISADAPAVVEVLEQVSPDGVILMEFNAFGVGWQHTCASDGLTVSCWGADMAALGPGGNPSTVELGGLASGEVVQIAAGTGHSCAWVDGGAQDDDRVLCWGQDGGGQLGDGPDTGEPREPVVVVGLPASVLQIAAGADHACAIGSDGQQQQVYCWGTNDNRQVTGVGEVVHAAVPIAVANEEVLAGPLGSLTAGARHTCVVDGEGGLWCWGANSRGQAAPLAATGADLDVATRVDTLDGDEPLWVQRVAAGERHTCAIDTAGRVWCWGCNEHGQLGGGTTGTSGCTNVAQIIEVTGLCAP